MEENTKQMIILADLSKKRFSLAKEIITIFDKYDVELFFYQEGEQVFLDGDRRIEDIKQEFLLADLVVNLLDIKLDASRKIAEAIDILGTKSIQNRIDSRLLFATKPLAKKILQQYDYKVPAFQKVEGQTSAELFNNFVQPSLISTKDRLYTSGALESLASMEEVLRPLFLQQQDLYIEEYIEGEDVNVFVYRKDDEVLAYTDYANNPVEQLDTRGIVEKSKDFFEKVGLRKFALIKCRYHKNRGLFFTDVCVDLNILTGGEREVLDSILEKEGKSIQSVLD